MPKIYEYFGFIFFFFSNEHEPIHVHVTMSDKDAKSAEDFIRAYYKNIVEKWMNFFVLKKKVRCTQITKKVK